MPGATRPYVGLIGVEEAVEIDAMVEAGVHLRTIEVLEGIEGGVVREEYGIGDGGIRGEARIFEYAAVEEELQEERIGPVPALGAVVGLKAEAMVRRVGTE